MSNELLIIVLILRTGLYIILLGLRCDVLVRQLGCRLSSVLHHEFASAFKLRYCGKGVGGLPIKVYFTWFAYVIVVATILLSPLTLPTTFSVITMVAHQQSPAAYLHEIIQRFVHIGRDGTVRYIPDWKPTLNYEIAEHSLVAASVLTFFFLAKTRVALRSCN
ncbi:hypothetical protein BYT27DRAFT_6529266 [Phlegmacium glaucopus]|nr:hypothetical protein BYT27DRAFT_6529266 [Phlegmacium glaucopus]